MRISDWSADVCSSDLLEPLSGYLRLGQGLLVGEPLEGPWNFGPAADATLPVQALVTQMQAQWPGLRCEHHPGPHPHEAKTLQLDCSKAAQTLAWRAVWNADATLQHTTQWYRSYYERGQLRSHAALQDYVAADRAAGLGR